MIYGTKIRGRFPVGDYREGMTGMDIIKSGFDKFDKWHIPMICQEKMDGWFGIVVRGDGDCYSDRS